MDALTRHNVKIFGTGSRTLLFAHGYGCDQSMWRWVAPAFEEDYRIVLFDYVGHGQADVSGFNAKRYESLQGYADDVLEICDAVKLREATLVGHSVSAIIGILAALKNPGTFDSMVLIGPSPRYINDGDYVGGFTRADIDGLLDFLDSNHLGWSSTMAPVIMGNPGKPELSKELENSFCRTHPEVAKHFARVTFLSDNRADLERVECPCLIIQCTDDAIAPLAVGGYVHGHIPGSKLIVLKATGHCPHLSDPAATIQAMKAFLSTCPRGSQRHSWS